MVRQTIACIWENGQSPKGKKPTAKEMEDLIASVDRVFTFFGRSHR